MRPHPPGAFPGVRTEYLSGIWNDLWPVEDQIFSEVSKQVDRWRKKRASQNEMTALHLQLTKLAMNAMQHELLEMKQNALALKLVNLILHQTF